jgi:hypothetical protein
MAHDRNKIPTLYKKLLTLYPRAFEERLGESMEQTFNDLYKERKQQPGHGFFLLLIFTDCQTTQQFVYHRRSTGRNKHAGPDRHLWRIVAFASRVRAQYSTTIAQRRIGRKKKALCAQPDGRYRHLNASYVHMGRIDRRRNLLS